MNFSFPREMEGAGVCLDAQISLTRSLSAELLQGGSRLGTGTLWVTPSTKSKLWLSGGQHSSGMDVWGEFPLRYQRGKSWKSSEGGEGCTLLLFALEGP